MKLHAAHPEFPARIRGLRGPICPRWLRPHRCFAGSLGGSYPTTRRFARPHTAIETRPDPFNVSHMSMSSAVFCVIRSTSVLAEGLNSGRIRISPIVIFQFLPWSSARAIVNNAAALSGSSAFSLALKSNAAENGAVRLFSSASSQSFIFPALACAPAESNNSSGSMPSGTGSHTRPTACA